MVRFAWLAVLAFGACASNPGAPAFRTSPPAPVTPVGAPRPAEAVWTEMRPLPWWTLAGTPELFILAFDEPARPVRPGRRVGPVRSRDVELDTDVLDAVRCAWMIVPMGEPRPCLRSTREDAMVRAHDPVTAARTDLRAAAGAVGAGGVTDIRCFAAARSVTASGRERRPARLWCEGRAVAAAGESGGPAVIGAAAPASEDPAAPVAHAPRTPPSRFVFAADGSVGALGRAPVVASTVSLRFSPLEVGLVVADLQRETLAPQPGGLVGLGVTALGRHAIGGSRVDALVGVSAMAVAVNGSTNPDFDGHYQGFVGLAYQSPWRLGGVAQPFVQLRAGVARGAEVAPTLQPVLELHLGLSTPERR